jgi:hypothetical protein
MAAFMDTYSLSRYVKNGIKITNKDCFKGILVDIIASCM